MASSSLREAVLAGSAQPFDFPVEYGLTADQVLEDSVGSAQYSYPLVPRCASTPCCDTPMFHLIINVKPAVLWCTSIMITGTLTRRYYGASISTWWPVLTCVRIKGSVLSSRPSSYWVIQAGLLTPLTFAQHCLSPFAVFTSGAYFLHNGRQWQWICKFYTANFKEIFGGP